MISRGKTLVLALAPRESLKFLFSIKDLTAFDNFSIFLMLMINPSFRLSNYLSYTSYWLKITASSQATASNILVCSPLRPQKQLL